MIFKAKIKDEKELFTSEDLVSFNKRVIYGDEIVEAIMVEVEGNVFVMDFLKGELLVNSEVVNNVSEDKISLLKPVLFQRRLKTMFVDKGLFHGLGFQYTSGGNNEVVFIKIYDNGGYKL